ncbi:MAG: hypothetical protein ACRDJ5_10685, partial [Actinomycetota bacterium]
MGRDETFLDAPPGYSRAVRTVIEGLRSLHGSPLALVPLTAEGLLGALLVSLGVLPAEGATAPATAVFPLDVYFDVKSAIAYAPGWWWVVGALGLSILVRGGVLAATLWLADGAPGAFASAW